MNATGTEKYAQLPEELKRSTRWVNYKIEDRGNGKTLKVPVRAGRGIDITNPDDWVSFEQAVAADPEHVGLVIAHPYIGIDLDDCRDPATGEVEDWARLYVEDAHSDTELSPSGRGFHIWLRGSPPNGADGQSKGAARKDGVEIYSRRRYFTMTGNHLDGTPLDLRDLNAVEVARLYARVEAGRDSKAIAVTGEANNRVRYVLRQKTKELLRFDPAGKPDQSGPVASLLTNLMIDTGLDGKATELLFKHSALYTSPTSHWGPHSKENKWERLRVSELENAHRIAQPIIVQLLRGRIVPEIADPDAWRELFHTYEEMKNAPPLRFVIQDFLQADGATLIGGLSGHGKTLAMLATAKALLEGTTLFSQFKVTEPARRVIYLIPEVPQGPFFHRLSTIFRLDEFIKDDRLLVRTLSKGETISLTDPRLLKAAEGADVFLDTAIRFMDGNENDATDNQKGLANHIFQLQHAGARTIVGAHHSPKGFERETRMTLENVLRGSGDIGAMLATAWGVRQLNPERNLIWVENIKARDFDPPKPFRIEGRPHLDNTGYFQLVSEPGKEEGTLAEHLGQGKPGPKPDPRSDALKLQILKLNREGKSERLISEELGVPKTNVHRLLKKAQLEELGKALF
jgi:hypothetical protein